MPIPSDDDPTGQRSILLNDGTAIPTIGLGTFGLSGDVGVGAIRAALAAGYRLLDTAAAYDTEAEVGRAVREGGVPRDEIVITTKIPGSGMGYDEARQSIRDSLERLGLDRIDLHLIHWPMPRLGRYVATWRALVNARADGEIRSIGVSNFNPDHLRQIIDATGVVPAVNQIELHPHFPQRAALQMHRELGIQTQSWTPLGRGPALLAAPPVAEVAARHGATPAQVVLRWHQQIGSVPIPRSSDPDRQRENLRLGQVQLDERDIAAITALGAAGGRLWGGDPETTEFR